MFTVVVYISVEKLQLWWQFLICITFKFTEQGFILITSYSCSDVIVDSLK